jgi:hypothetical protein
MRKIKNNRAIICSTMILLLCAGLFPDDKEQAKPDIKKEKTEYQKYQDLSKRKKTRMVREYVRKDGYFFRAQRGPYRVYSTVGPENALQYTLLMQDFHARISPFFKVKPKSEFKPQVYVTKTRESMIRLAKRHITEKDHDVGKVGAWSHGLYSPYLRRLYVYEGKHTLQCLFHEGTHQYLHYLLGKNYESLARWIDEGLATNFETWNPMDSIETNLKKSRERSSRKYVLREMFWKRKLPMSVKELTSLSKDSWAQARGRRVDYQYTAAWSFTDFLLNSEKGKELLNLVFEAARDGLTIPSEAITSYEDEWKKYVKEKVLPLIEKEKEKKTVKQ